MKLKMKLPCSRKVIRKHVTVSSPSKLQKKLIVGKGSHLQRQNQTPAVAYEPQSPHLRRRRKCLWLQKLVLKNVCYPFLIAFKYFSPYFNNTTSRNQVKEGSLSLRASLTANHDQAAGHVMSHSAEAMGRDILECGEVCRRTW